MAKPGKEKEQEAKKACEKTGNTENRKPSGIEHSQTTSTSFLQDFSVTVSPVRR
jgi:hypothetical protein